MKLNGKIVLITGASSGLGAAMAKEAAKKGAKIILVARRAEALKKISDEINSNNGCSEYYQVDVTDFQAVAQFKEQLLKEVGIPDIIINNAGSGIWRFVQETKPEQVSALMAAPYFAAFYVTNAFLGAMLKRNSGQIVNITSPASKAPWPGATGYVAARWAVNGFTEALRNDLSNTAIRVSLVNPPYITDSEYFQANPGSLERLPKAAKMIPGKGVDELASDIIKGIEKGKKNIVPSFMLRMFFIMNHFAPAVVRKLLTSTSPALEKLKHS